jgi:hypothetical protein
MKKIGLTRITTVLLLSLVLAGCSSLLSYEEEISFEQLPEIIQQLVLQEIDVEQIIEIEKEEEFFRIRYSIEYLNGEEEWELEYNNDGELLSHERD